MDAVTAIKTVIASLQQLTIPATLSNCQIMSGSIGLLQKVVEAVEGATNADMDKQGHKTRSGNGRAAGAGQQAADHPGAEHEPGGCGSRI